MYQSESLVKILLSHLNLFILRQYSIIGKLKYPDYKFRLNDRSGYGEHDAATCASARFGLELPALEGNVNEFESTETVNAQPGGPERDVLFLLVVLDVVHALGRPYLLLGYPMRHQRRLEPDYEVGKSARTEKGRERERTTANRDETRMRTSARDWKTKSVGCNNDGGDTIYLPDSFAGKKANFFFTHFHFRFYRRGR